MISIMPYVDSVFECITNVKKQIFSASDFFVAYNRMNLEVEYKEMKLSAERALQCLFYFSVVGNQNKRGKQIFRYKSKSAKIDFDESLIAHPGLLKTLQI